MAFILSFLFCMCIGVLIARDSPGRFLARSAFGTLETSEAEKGFHGSFFSSRPEQRRVETRCRLT